MLDNLLDLAKEENEPNRYTYSEEYNKLYNELDSKTLIIDELEKELGCPIDVYVKIQIGLVDTIYVKRYETIREYWNENGLQLEQRECLEPRPIIRVGKRDFCYQDILGREYITFSEYGTEFWLKEDRSE